MPSTGEIWFGVNQEGLINVFAKDIGQLGTKGQQLWGAHNVAPNGTVCEELISAQMRCEPAETLAPEVAIREVLSEFQSVGQKVLGDPLLIDHSDVERLLKGVHRFRSLDKSGFLQLAKDLTSVTVERFDMKTLTVRTADADSKLGSIKRLDRVLSHRNVDGRQLTGPLVGLYELRLADAHLSSSALKSSFSLVGMQGSVKWLFLGMQLIEKVASAFVAICQAFYLRGDRGG